MRPDQAQGERAFRSQRWHHLNLDCGRDGHVRESVWPNSSASGLLHLLNVDLLYVFSAGIWPSVEISCWIENS
jgi:hypothetical protein